MQDDSMWLTPTTGHCSKKAPHVKNKTIILILIGLTLKYLLETPSNSVYTP